MRRSPRTEEFYSDELVGRKVTNAFGKREIVVLPRDNWDYLYWLDQFYDIRKWIIDLDLVRGENSLASVISYWLGEEWERREREGEIQPEWWRGKKAA